MRLSIINYKIRSIQLIKYSSCVNLKKKIRLVHIKHDLIWLIELFCLIVTSFVFR